MTTRDLTIVTLIALSLSTASIGHEKDLKAECARTKQKIRDIQSKMRSGYTRAQGEKLEAQLRKLRSKRNKVCR